MPFPSPGDLPHPGMEPGPPVHGQRLYCLSHRRSPQFQQRNWDSEFCTELAHSQLPQVPFRLVAAMTSRFCSACWVHRWFRHPLRKQGMVILPPSPQWRGGPGPLLSLEGREFQAGHLWTCPFWTPLTWSERTLAPSPSCTGGLRPPPSPATALHAHGTWPLPED